MGVSQLNLPDWNKFEEILEYALSLQKSEQKAFLIETSAICWCIWKHRNDVCSSHKKPHSIRTMFIMINSTVNYRIGPRSKKKSW